MRRPRLAVVLFAIAFIGGCGAAPAAVPADDTPRHWQQLATQDILAAHRALAAAHPGAIDPGNPGFREWLDGGPAKALAYVPRVRSYDDMLSVVRLYTAGFHDGHLFYSDDTRRSSDMTVDGWHVAPKGTSAVVDGVAPDWPVALPPIGAAFLGCDERAASRLLAEDIEPFTQAPVGDAGQRELWGAVTRPPLDDMRWRTCRFMTSDGHALALPQAWKAVTWDIFVPLMLGARHAPSPRTNSVEHLPDGTLWIRAANFQPSAQDSVALERMLHALRDEPTARRVVFDARGNGGGDSGIGQRIVWATTGGFDIDASRLDDVAVTSAWWRVSDIAVASLALREPMFAARGGDEATLRAVRQLREAMTVAQAHGEAWIHQPGSDSPRLSRADLVARHAHPVRPIGQVALLTDENCVSACLDFADLVRAIPGALHIGRTTDADTVYLDIGSTRLPSGNALVLPLKVWRNRLRGDNEALVPDVPLAFDQPDEEATRRVVLDLLDQHAAAVR